MSKMNMQFLIRFTDGIEPPETLQPITEWREDVWERIWRPEEALANFYKYGRNHRVLADGTWVREMPDTFYVIEDAVLDFAVLWSKSYRVTIDFNELEDYTGVITIERN